MCAVGKQIRWNQILTAQRYPQVSFLPGNFPEKEEWKKRQMCLCFRPGMKCRSGKNRILTAWKISIRSAFPFLPGNNYEEVRQIREYRDGDSVRHIYWNQTARRDSLWVKEYEEETKGRAVLLYGMEIREEDQCRELLCVLYRALETDGGKESVYAAEPPDLQGAMRLTLDLVWFKGEDLIFRFSEENLGQELSRQNFEL